MPRVISILLRLGGVAFVGVAALSDFWWPREAEVGLPPGLGWGSGGAKATIGLLVAACLVTLLTLALPKLRVLAVAAVVACLAAIAAVSAFTFSFGDHGAGQTIGPAYSLSLTGLVLACVGLAATGRNQAD
jgi:hypothetical protein